MMIGQELQPRHQKQSYHRNTEAEIRQGELRQQRDRAPTSSAEIVAHTNHAIEGAIHQCAGIKTVADERLLSLALRAMVWAVVVRIGDRSGILLEGANKRMQNLHDSPFREWSRLPLG
jgi:hypothetical protein